MKPKNTVMPPYTILVEEPTLSKYDVWIKRLKKALYISLPIWLLISPLFSWITVSYFNLNGIERPVGKFYLTGDITTVGAYIAYGMTFIVIILVWLLNIIEGLRYRKVNGSPRKVLLTVQILSGMVMLFVSIWASVLIMLLTHIIFGTSMTYDFRHGAGF